jgi:hypothetical protein
LAASAYRRFQQAGPRQSGKTTLAQMIADEHANRLYFNWDIPTDRIRMIKQPFFSTGFGQSFSRTLISSSEKSPYKTRISETSGSLEKTWAKSNSKIRQVTTPSLGMYRSFSSKSSFDDISA